MFVRWKTQKRADYRSAGKRTPVQLYSAYLVESVRVNGKPRQKTTYLASIKDKYTGYANHQLYFWKRIQAKIQPLNLSYEQQRAIKNKLLERVPDVTQEQLQTENEALAREMRLINARLGIR